MLDTYGAIESALRHFADPVQPRTGSVTTVPSGRSAGERVPFHASLLERLDERQELKARMQWLDDEEQVVLLRWYVEGARAETIAHHLRCSVRHVYRVRARAMARLVELGVDDEFADVDVAEFVAV